MKNHFKSQRAKAWRNLIVAATNAALEQGLFSFRVNDNRWPGAGAEERQGYVFRFKFLGMPCSGYVGDIGWGELSIHAALNPPEGGEDRVRACNAGFWAGEAFASGCLERELGAYMQTCSSLYIRRHLIPIIAAAKIEPVGYRDHR